MTEDKDGYIHSKGHRLCFQIVWTALTGERFSLVRCLWQVMIRLTSKLLTFEACSIWNSMIPLRLQDLWLVHWIGWRTTIQEKVHTLDTCWSTQNMDWPASLFLLSHHFGLVIWYYGLMQPTLTMLYQMSQKQQWHSNILQLGSRLSVDKGCFGSYMKPYNLILLSMILQLE